MFNIGSATYLDRHILVNMHRITDIPHRSLSNTVKLLEVIKNTKYILNSMVQHPVARVLQKFINLHRTQLQLKLRTVEVNEPNILVLNSLKCEYLVTFFHGIYHVI
jgi:hypothetical protein